MTNFPKTWRDHENRLSVSRKLLLFFVCLPGVLKACRSDQVRQYPELLNLPRSFNRWSFYGESGERVIMYALKTSGSMSGAYLKLYDTGGSVEDQNPGSSGIDRQLKKTGLYEISVEAGAQSGTGDYSLTFQKLPGPVSAPGDLDGGTVIPGMKYSGTIDEISDFDAYQFYGQAGDTVRIYALKKSGNMTDIYLKLYPGDGADAESENSGADGIEHQLSKTGLVYSNSRSEQP